MKAFLLGDITRLRTHLVSERQLFEPQRSTQSSDLHWLPAKSDSDISESSITQKPVLPTSPAKQFFFTEREQLFQFDGERFIETLPQIQPRVLFGVRSCDLCAIAYQDQFFREDPYYQTRRQATLLVGLDCTTPCDGGFCPTVDAGPFVRDGQSDLVCHRLGEEGWLLIALSDKGEDAIQGLELEAAPEAWLTRRNLQETGVAAQFPETPYISAGIQRINQREVPAEIWEAMGLQCLSCSGCTSLCPTCSCFATYDRPLNNGFERERCWDSCLYEAFQREASGHNPSVSAGQRVERFWFHKFSDDYVETFGQYGCTRCGRCEKTCPGIIGAHSVMKRISALS